MFTYKWKLNPPKDNGRGIVAFRVNIPAEVTRKNTLIEVPDGYLLVDVTMNTQYDKTLTDKTEALRARDLYCVNHTLLSDVMTMRYVGQNVPVLMGSAQQKIYCNVPVELSYKVTIHHYTEFIREFAHDDVYYLNEGSTREELNGFCADIHDRVKQACAQCLQPSFAKALTESALRTTVEAQRDRIEEWLNGQLAPHGVFLSLQAIFSDTPFGEAYDRYMAHARQLSILEHDQELAIKYNETRSILLKQRQDEEQHEKDPQVKI